MKHFLFAFLLLALAGCATTSPQTVQKPQELEKTAAVVAPSVPVTDKVEEPMQLGPPSQKLDSVIATPSSVIASTSEEAKKEYSDIWARLRAGFTMKPLDSPLVAREIQWFVNNPEYMQRMMERARLYLYYIVEEVEKRGVPMEIALLPAIESAYKPNAYSRARAVGLWQFMPATGRLYGLKANWWYDGRRDVEASTRAALDYLEKLYNEFDGDWHLALAAYNAGEGKVGRMMEYNRRKGKSTDYSYLKLKRETQHYVPKLMAMVSLVADPEKYGVQLASIPNTPYFTKVATGSQIDLGVVAKLVDVPIGDLHNINPGYTRWATDPNGSHHLLIPADKKDIFLTALSNLPPSERIQWQHHAVKHGDTIHSLSRRYGVAVDVLRAANRLPSNLLRAGQDVLIPMSSRALIATAPPVMRTAYRASSIRTSKNGAPVIHRVRSGETLWAISRRYNVLVHQLKQWNFLERGEILRRGQRLKIWTSGGPTASLDAAASKS